MKGYKILLAILLIGAATSSTLAQTPSELDMEKQMAVLKFERLLNYIHGMYVDSVDTETLVEDAFVGMLEELDPHSIYIPKKEVEQMNAPLKG
ncbi:MAG: hypothetical protein JKY54_17995, partial [Flavobacteriales bacterium]|nr:hypothetical protein [Flavobacteriales bacterium]